MIFPVKVVSLGQIHKGGEVEEETFCAVCQLFSDPTTGGTKTIFSNSTHGPLRSYQNQMQCFSNLHAEGFIMLLKICFLHLFKLESLEFLATF